MQQLVSKTDGVPLFVEELTKMVVESGLVPDEWALGVTCPLPPLAIPSTCKTRSWPGSTGSAPAKEIAQLGATLGREFPMSCCRPSPR